MMKASVSSSLKIILWYFLIGIFGTLFCAAIYMVYSLCQNMVAGESLAAFSYTYFLRGLVFCVSPVFELSSILLVFYLVRHPSKSVIPVIVYVILGLVSWFGLSPMLNLMSVKIASSGIFQPEEIHISSGYFREKDNNILFYSRVTDDDVADGLCIALDGSVNHAYTFENQKIQSTQKGFRDNLVQDSLEADFFLRQSYNGIYKFMDLQNHVISKGYLAWFWFAFMGLSLLSVIGLRNCSKWRLLNIMAIILSVMIVIAFNMLSYSTNTFMTRIVLFVNTSLSFLSFVYNPFAVICNLIFCIVMFILGMIFDSAAKKSMEGGF